MIRSFLANLLFFAFSMQTVSLIASIKIVATTALSDRHYDYRLQQYVNSFTALRNFGYSDFFIVESVAKNGPTFLEEYSKNVFYSTANDPKLKNYGINEAKTLLECCAHYNFEPDDMIIKLTGRHAFGSDRFFKIVENNPDMDAIVKINEYDGVLTLAFAMRYKFLKEMYEQIDYDRLEKYLYSIEYSVGEYVKRKKNEGTLKVRYIDNLGIKSNFYGSTCEGVINDEPFEW